MEIRYFNKKVEDVCNSLDAAKKKYPLKTAEKLIKAINFIESAACLNDIVNFSPFHFHNLRGNRNGPYSICFNGTADSYRLIIKPLDDNGEPYKNMSIDEYSKITKIVLILEVSKHYE